jgi:2-keto-myo-inositol isomerase
MLLGFNGATSMKADLATDVAAASGAGFRALEIWAKKLDTYLSTQGDLDALNALLRQHNIAAASINSIEFITFRPLAEYQTIRSRCEELCQRAQALGCDKVVVVPSPTPKEGASRDAIQAESVRVLRELGAMAEPYGVRLAFEFLGFPWCSVRTLAQSWEIVQATARSNVGLVIDTCHFYAGGSSLQSIESVQTDKILIFHINDVEQRPKETIQDAHRLLPGEGVIPLDEIELRLQRIGFDGLCSIELFRPAYWERDPAELALAARAAMLRVLQPHFQVH